MLEESFFKVIPGVDVFTNRDIITADLYHYLFKYFSAIILGDKVI